VEFVAPEAVLLRGVEQQAGLGAGDDEFAPEAGCPLRPGECVGGFPCGVAQRTLTRVEGRTKLAGCAGVGQEESLAAVEFGHEFGGVHRLLVIDDLCRSFASVACGEAVIWTAKSEEG
jgi:hypothetical protein